MERLTKKSAEGTYEWSERAEELIKLTNDPTIIGKRVREFVGVCEDHDLTPEGIAELVKTSTTHTRSCLKILEELEAFRKKHEHMDEPSDWAIRMCQALVARHGGYSDRNEWTEALSKREIVIGDDEHKTLP